MAEFEPAFKFVMKHEDSTLSGKVTWDRGGRLTKWGISQRYHPHVDVEHLTLKGAKEIYFTEYWLPFKLDQLTSQEVASKAMDCLVNIGRGFAKDIQKLVNVRQDGNIGPLTIERMNSCNPDILIDAICHAQIEHYKRAAAFAASEGRTYPLEGLLNRARDIPA